MFHLHRPEQVHAVARFRMGAHSLAIECGRHAGVPRQQRLCPCCGLQREDEWHLWCECPMYAAVRRAHADLFVQGAEGGDDAMRACMNGTTGEHWRGVADFLLKCYSIRDRYIAEAEVVD